MLKRLLPLTLVVVAVAVAPARGEYIPWSYSTSVFTGGPGAVSPWIDGFWVRPGPGYAPPTGLAPVSQDAPFGPWQITTTENRAEFAGTQGMGSDSASITALQLRGVLLQPGKDIFLSNSGLVNLGLTLTDEPSKASGTLSFQARLLGWSEGPLALQFSGPTTQTLTLGNDRYTVNLSPYTTFPFPDSGWKNGFTSWQNLNLQVSVAEVPEPSALALAGLGLGCLGVRAWRRRRANPSGA